MVVKEYWWAGEESKAQKNLRWAKPTSGQRADILTWLRAQEAKIGRRSPIEETNAASIDDDDELEPVEDGDAI